MRSLLPRLRALDEFESLLRRRALVDDGSDPANHSDGIRRLPDVSPHVDALRAFLDRVVRELEGVEFRLEFRTPRDNEGDGTGFHDLREFVAVIRLHEVG